MVNGTLLDRISGDGLIVASYGIDRLFAFGGRADRIARAGLLCAHAGLSAHHERAALRGLRKRPYQRARVGRRLRRMPCSTAAARWNFRERSQITIVKSMRTARFVRLTKRDYFGLLRRKLSPVDALNRKNDQEAPG